MLRLLIFTSLFLIVSARIGWCPDGFKAFKREPTAENDRTSFICLGVVTASGASKNRSPDEVCHEHESRFVAPETYEEAEWLWNQTHVGDGILINGLLTVVCNTTNVNGKIEGLCDYDDDWRKKVVTTRDMKTDPALVKYELVLHPELELYNAPKTLPSVRSYVAYCPLFLKKQVWYDIPRLVDAKFCGTKKEIRENFGKDGRKSVVCASAGHDDQIIIGI